MSGWFAPSVPNVQSRGWHDFWSVFAGPQEMIFWCSCSRNIFLLSLNQSGFLRTLLSTHKTYSRAGVIIRQIGHLSCVWLSGVGSMASICSSKPCQECSLQLGKEQPCLWRDTVIADSHSSASRCQGAGSLEAWVLGSPGLGSAHLRAVSADIIRLYLTLPGSFLGSSLDLEPGGRWWATFISFVESMNLS